MSNKLENLSDKELIERCITSPNDEITWREFFLRYYDFIYINVKTNIIKYGLNHSVIDDIIQDVLKKVIIALRRNIIKNYSPQSFNSYLYKIIRKTVTDFIRKEKKMVKVPLNEIEKEVSFVNNDEQALNNQIRIHSKRIKEGGRKILSSGEFQIINLVFENKSSKEISEILNISIDTVYTLKSRAVKKLRKVFLKSN